MHVKCIAIDFDGTLAAFKGGYDGLFAIFSRRGVELAVVKECYEQTKRGCGFLITAMTAVVAGRMGCCFDQQRIECEFKDWLGLSLIPYPDSVVTLAAWQCQGIPVVILTAGNAEYQTQKVQATRMPHDELIVVSHEREKSGVVCRLLECYGPPLILIEDRPSVLDSVRECGFSEDEVFTVRLLRQESPYVRENSVYRHCSYNTLDEVFLTIES